MAVCGCRAGVAPEQTVALDDYPRNQVLRGDEWRWARRVPGGVTRIVELGRPESQHAAVRLGVMPRGVSGETLRVTVLAGAGKVGSFETADPLVWTDRRVELGVQGQGKPCRVRFQSESDFLLSTCELVDTAANQPNVIIVLIDAMRADHLHCYGYSRPTSPHIDAVAENAARFDNCIAQSSWTRPSVATLLTGCYPNAHGATDRDSVMRAGLPTLGGNLNAQGYETHAYIGNVMCLPVWGMANEFDRALFVHDKDTPKIGDDVIMGKALDAIGECHGRPFFFYLHLLGTHTPYNSREPYDSTFGATGITGMKEGTSAEELINCYDAELAFSDVQVGLLVERLRSLGLYDNTVLIITADHGEQFYEHGEFGHGMSLHVEEVRVPLIVKPAGSAGAGVVCSDVIQLVDLAPTLLEMLKVAPEPRFQGRSFAQLFKGKSLNAPMAYSSLQLEKRSAYMAQNDRTKFIKDLAQGRESWFDLERDPFERQPLPQSSALPGKQELVDFAGEIASLENHGLNMLITTGGGKTQVVSGRLRGDGVKLPQNAPSDFCTVTEEDGGFAFDVDFGDVRTRRPGSTQWHDAVQQESAQLRFSSVSGKRISLEIKADGNPVSASEIFLGSPKTARHPVDNTVELSQIAADSRAFDPLLLDRRFAVYVWYVPPPATVSNEALEPDVRNAMEALGYLH